MKIKIFVLFLSFFFQGVFIYAQQLQTVSIGVTEDTYIMNSGNSNKNFNKSKKLQERSWVYRRGLRSEVRDESKVLLKFDLSNLPENIEIKSAYLTVYSSSFYNNLITESIINVLKIENYWESSSVTWNNFTHPEKIITQQNIKLSNEIVPVDIDLTKEIISIVNKGSVNNGWLISSELKDARNANFTFSHNFLSKEYKRGEFKAQLNIEYTVIPKIKYRGLYVNDFYLILGDEEQENAVIEYALCQGFNQLYLRRMRNCELWHSENRAKLRNFIRKAKKSGLKSVGAFCESAQSIYNNKIDLYNQEASDFYEFIDAYHLDFHYWHKTHPQEYYCKQYLQRNGYSCDNDGAFNFFLSQLELFQGMRGNYPYPIEISFVLENVKEYEAEVIKKYIAAGYVQNIHFSLYRKPNSNNEINLYNYKRQRERLSLLNNEHTPIYITPVFITHEKTGIHIGDWLFNKHGSIGDAEQNYMDGFINEIDPLINSNIRFERVAWSRYTDMPPANCGIDNEKIVKPKKLNTFVSIKVSEEKNIQIFNNLHQIHVDFKANEDEKFEEGNIIIFSIDGRVVHTEMLNYYENTVNFKAIKGIYIVKVTQGSNTVSQKLLLGE